MFECKSVKELWDSLDCRTTKYNCKHFVPSEIDNFIDCFNALSNDTVTKEQILKEVSQIPVFEMDRLCKLVKADMISRNPEHKSTNETEFLKSNASISYIALQEGILPSTLYDLCYEFQQNERLNFICKSQFRLMFMMNNSLHRE